jgi:type I restriction enzyme S subunit
MSAVDERRGAIARAETKPFGQVKKGYTYFEDGDVLFAKITPCMQNGKHAIARDLVGGFGFGTTEFHVLHPRPAIIPDWIHFFIRQPEVLENAKAYFTGAVGQQRVPQSYLADLAIPLPPVEAQKRIAAILNEQMAAVERARAGAEAQLEAAKALPAAYLRAVFSSREAQQWPILPIGTLGDPTRGDAVQTGPFGAQLPSTEFKPTGVPVLNIGNVQWGYLDLSRLDHVSPQKAADLDRYIVHDGDLLFTRSGTIGRCCIVPKPCSGWLISYHLLRVAFDCGKVCPDFAAAALRGFEGVQAQLRLISGRGATRDGVNSTILAELCIPVPPLPEQQRVTAKLKEQMASPDRGRKAIEEELDVINKLPAALLRRAFAGEL